MPLYLHISVYITDTDTLNHFLHKKQIFFILVFKLILYIILQYLP